MDGSDAFKSFFSFCTNSLSVLNLQPVLFGRGEFGCRIVINTKETRSLPPCDFKDRVVMC